MQFNALPYENLNHTVDLYTAQDGLCSFPWLYIADSLVLIKILPTDLFPWVPIYSVLYISNKPHSLRRRRHEKLNDGTNYIQQTTEQEKIIVN